MKLFAVRQVDDKQAVGFFWADGEGELPFAVDEITEPDFCEFCKIDEPGGFVWDDEAPGLLVERKDDDEVHRLMSKMSPVGSLDTFFFGEDDSVHWLPMVLIGDMPRAIRRPRQPSIPLYKKLRHATNSAEKQPDPGVCDTIYFIRAADHIKIGITGMNVKDRLKALATAHYDELKVLATITNAPAGLEQQLHEKFAALRVRGEWFRAEPELLAYIESLKQ